MLIQGALNLIEKGQGRRIQTTSRYSYEMKNEQLNRDIDFTIEINFVLNVVVGNNINGNELKSKFLILATVWLNGSTKSKSPYTY